MSFPPSHLAHPEQTPSRIEQRLRRALTLGDTEAAAELDELRQNPSLSLLCLESPALTVAIDAILSRWPHLQRLSY